MWPSLRRGDRALAFAPLVRDRHGRRVYEGWYVAAACLVVIALISPLIASFPIFFVAILRDLGWSRGQLSTALAIHLVLCGLSSPLAGGLIDRFGARRVMPLAALLTAAAVMVAATAWRPWQFYLSFGVAAAIGSAMLHVVPLTTIISNWFVRHRGTAIGLVTAGSGAGQFLMLPLLQALIDRIGWRGAYVVLAAAILIVPSALIWQFVYTRPEDRGLTSDDESGRTAVAAGGAAVLGEPSAATAWTIRRAARSFRFWALLLVLATFGGGFFLVSVQLVAYLADHGYGALLAASVVGLQGLINVFGKFAGGVLSDRIGRAPTLTLSVAIFLVALVLLSLAGVVHSPALVYVFAIVYGIGYGMALPALMTSAADLFQGRHFGSILGVLTLGGFVGGAIGTRLGGYLFDVTKTYEVNFVAAGLAMIVSAALIWTTRPGRANLGQRAVRTERVALSGGAS